MIHDLETERIKGGIRRIALNHTRKITDAEAEQWATELRPYAGPMLAKVLQDFALGDEWPNLGQIRAKYFSDRKANEAGKPPLPLTERERARSDTAAIYSMLWLIYEKRWRVEDFAGHAIARAFGRDPAEALRAAMMQFSREDVARWMEQQPV